MLPEAGVSMILAAVFIKKSAFKKVPVHLAEVMIRSVEAGCT
jgi:hypothetical protein